MRETRDLAAYACHGPQSRGRQHDETRERGDGGKSGAMPDTLADTLADTHWPAARRSSVTATASCIPERSDG